MAVNKEEILETISNMTVLEVVELVEAMEEKFGVSAAAMAAPVAAAAPADSVAAGSAEEQTEFCVTLTGFGDNKVSVIKVVRDVTGLGLKEAKKFVEEVPSVLKEAVSKEESEDIKKRFEEAGAAVKIE